MKRLAELMTILYLELLYINQSEQKNGSIVNGQCGGRLQPVYAL